MWPFPSAAPLLFFNTTITTRYCLVPKKKKTDGACNILQTLSLARPLSFSTTLVESKVESQELEVWLHDHAHAQFTTAVAFFVSGKIFSSLY